MGRLVTTHPASLFTWFTCGVFGVFQAHTLTSQLQHIAPSYWGKEDGFDIDKSALRAHDQISAMTRRLFHRLTAALSLVAMLGGTLSAAAPGRWGVRWFEATSAQRFELDYFDGNALVRRELDLNFDERIDFVESFD